MSHAHSFALNFFYHEPARRWFMVEEIDLAVGWAHAAARSSWHAMNHLTPHRRMTQ